MSKPFKRKRSPLFQLGVIVFTQAVREHLELYRHDASDVLSRHVAGDWGDLPLEDARENEFALEQPLRIFSSYEVAGQRIWVITEADRNATTLIFPHEY
ncbi:hypothetical protein [Polaromonas sp. OV174]|uniref:hypothetical protein n=1 Tax=Polaromonas sp. OV174 TaxID=1855300 RepID=UPI000B877369|nr:hypothetical protein [Polaromonas sp. OV174]